MNPRGVRGQPAPRLPPALGGNQELIDVRFIFTAGIDASQFDQHDQFVCEQVFDRAPRTHYQDVLRKFATREGIRFIDLYDGLVARDPHPLYWSWDPHLTPAGHRVVAELLCEATKDLLHE